MRAGSIKTRIETLKTVAGYELRLRVGSIKTKIATYTENRKEYDRYTPARGMD